MAAWRVDRASSFQEAAPLLPSDGKYGPGYVHSMRAKQGAAGLYRLVFRVRVGIHGQIPFQVRFRVRFRLPIRGHVLSLAALSLRAGTPWLWSARSRLVRQISRSKMAPRRRIPLRPDLPSNARERDVTGISVCPMGSPGRGPVSFKILRMVPVGFRRGARLNRKAPEGRLPPGVDRDSREPILGRNREREWPHLLRDVVDDNRNKAH